jgi:hypothetical protein
MSLPAFDDDVELRRRASRRRKEARGRGGDEAPRRSRGGRRRRGGAGLWGKGRNKWLGLGHGGAAYIPRPQRSYPTVRGDLIQRSGSGVWGSRADGVIGPCRVPGHRAEVAAQARSDAHAGLARRTMACVSCRASAELFRAVLVPAQRDWLIWTTIYIHLVSRSYPCRLPPCYRRRGAPGHPDSGLPPSGPPAVPR